VKVLLLPHPSDGVFNLSIRIEGIELMYATTKKSHRKREKKAITIPVSGSTGILSKKECKRLLGLFSEDTINDYFRTLGLFGQDFITWDDFKEILKLQMFLGLKPGYNSQTMFLTLRQQGIIDNLLDDYGININKRLEKIKNDYQQRQWQV
jgi:hypothetical protein